MNIGAGLRNIGHVIAENPGRTALLVGGLAVSALALSGCADSTPPPAPTDPLDQPLLNQLTSERFSNRDQHTVLNAIHANNWDHVEAGNMLSQVAPIVGQSDAIDAWRLTKVNGRSPAEMTGMMQSLDGLTNLRSDQISRVARDVISTGYSGTDATRFFTNAPGWTSSDQDINAFERLLGLRYSGWDSNSGSGGVVYDPYPVYVPNNQYGYDYSQQPDFWSQYRQTAGGDGNSGSYIPPYNSGSGTAGGDGPGGTGSTSTGDGPAPYTPPRAPTYTPPRTPTYTPPRSSTNSGPGNPGGFDTPPRAPSYTPPRTPTYTPPRAPTTRNSNSSGPGNPGFS